MTAPSSRYTADQITYLARGYQRHRIPELTLAFNAKFKQDRAEGAIKAALQNRKITCGRTGCFQKGNKPWDTGTKGAVKPNSGNFKKGDVPATIKPLWSERLDTKDGIILIKVPERNPYTGAPTRYLAKHIWIWTQANGPVPPAHIITFIDDDNKHCTLENLECISKAENCRRNKMQYLAAPLELRPSIKALAKLITATSEASRHG